VVTLVDRPPVSTATVEKSVPVWLGDFRWKWAVVPQYEGKHGHPIALAREMMEVFL